MTPSTDLMTSVMEVTKEVRNPKVRGMAKSIAIDPALNEGVLAMMERAAEMRSPMTALLAGIAAIPSARRMWEDSLDAMWEKNRVTSSLVPEVVIGSGFHAAVYCAVRAAMGEAPPIVLEASSRAGGTFAQSRSATFYLNSRNRPGGLSIPRNQGALNFLPGSMVQPADLSGEEYQVNSDIAFAIRSVFALTGVKVVTNTKVGSLRQTYKSRSYYSPEWYVQIDLSNGRRLKAERVVVATGIGEPVSPWGKFDRVLGFGEFLAHLDQPFPFRGMRRVAVIGAGDSGKCAVEALTGQGPSRHMSVASLDYPDQIVWFGQQSYDRTSFEECNRPRYKRIATLLETPSENRARRIQPRPERVDFVEQGYDCVLVNGEPFDFVVNCTGFRTGGTLDNRSSEVVELPELENGSARYVPKENRDYGSGPRIIYVGPAASIPRSPSERAAVPDASFEEARREALVAAYRYAGRTAMLAQSI